MPATSPVDVPRPLVLLVDDSQVVLRLLERSFHDQDFDLLTAGDAGGAMDGAAHARRLDLAVIDLSLPDMDAIDLAAQLRRRHHSLRVLYTSAYLSREEGFDLGDPVLRKPFGPHELARSIRDLLPTRRRLSPSDDRARTPGQGVWGTSLAFRIRVLPQFRAAYPGVPPSWLPAHRRATDRDAFWLDADAGGRVPYRLPILEPHVELATVEVDGPMVLSSDQREEPLRKGRAR